MKKTILIGSLWLAVLLGATFAFGLRWSDSNWSCPDSNNNWVCDWLEDFDNDGVVNNQDQDFIWKNATNNPYFVDEDDNGICDYRENGTTRLWWMWRRWWMWMWMWRGWRYWR